MNINDIIPDPPGNIKIKVKPISQGLGDSIKKVTSALGIKQCSGCKKRQEKLNRLFPYDNKRNNNG
jgi:hypothetical protein